MGHGVYCYCFVLSRRRRWEPSNVKKRNQRQSIIRIRSPLVGRTWKSYDEEEKTNKITFRKFQILRKVLPSSHQFNVIT